MRQQSPWAANRCRLADKLPQLHSGSLPKQFDSLTAPLIVLVSTYADDEPIEEVILAAKEITTPFTLLVTGKRVRAGTLLAHESDRIVFTDFLSHQDFDCLVRNADLIIDLSTLENCLVCGAYEAVSAGVPALLSDSKATRATFTKGCLYSENTTPACRQAIELFLANPEQYRQEMKELQSLFPAYWQAQFTEINQFLSSKTN